ncbi:response regulator, partial [Acinetobacter baumannii 18689]
MTVLLEKDLSPSEFTLFSEILWKLGSGKGQYNLRESILADIAILLRADFAASYIW